MSLADKQRAEQLRQTQALVEAIDKAIRETMATFEMPILNAAAGALVYTQAQIIATTPKEHRRALRKSMDRELKAAIGKASPKAKTVTIPVGRGTH